MPGVFLRQGEELVPMAEASYEAETLLQEMLERYPALLAADDVGAAQGEWLLIRREASLVLGKDGGPRGWLDHLFVDAAGVPTLVEVKRSSDSRVRREVVGQMLDYAANAGAHWKDDALRRLFEERCLEGGIDADETVRDAFVSVDDVGEFWESVRTNVAAERFRLVFVADAIPPELRRIVEYLNGQMTQTEVLAIEVKQYRDESGAHQTLVPRLIGRTEAARQAKGGPATRRWDRASLLGALEERGGAEFVDVTQRLFEWVDGRGDLREYFGSGTKDGSFQAGYWEKARYLWPFVLYTYGRVEIQFQHIAKRPPFDDPALREQLRAKLIAIPAVDLPVTADAKRPSLELTALAPTETFSIFTDAMDWAFAQANALRGCSDPLG
jgi:hypothetical protein